MGLLLAILMAIVAGVIPCNTAALDITTILKQVKQALEPSRTSIRKVVISSMDTEGRKVTQWTAAQALKKLPDGKRMLMVMLGPTDIQGTALLVHEQENQESKILVYLPAIPRVRVLFPVEAHEHFLGTEFTYADFDFIHLHERYRILGEEEHAGIRAYKIEEEIPQEPLYYYSRIITWVSANSFLPLQRDYYDTPGRLWKTELFEVSIIDKTPTPIRIVMKDVQRGFGTELKITDVDYRVEIPDEIFDPKLLPNAVNSPLWQRYRVQSHKVE